MHSNIKITRTLLDKDQSLLTPEEAEAVKKHIEDRKTRDERLEEANKRLAEECRILCSGGERNPIPDYGWMYPVEKLCYQIEDMNLRYAKYGIKVVLDQTKEKFGTLRFYTHISVDTIGPIRILLAPVDWLAGLLSKLDYKPVLVTDQEEYNTLEWREIDKKSFDERRNEYGTRLDEFALEISVVGTKEEASLEKAEGDTVYLVEENGRYFYSYVLSHLARRHREFRKHRIARWFLDRLTDLSLWLSDLRPETIKQRVFSHKVDLWTDELVNRTDRECQKVCQFCGKTFMDYPGMEKCETQGWYMYICEDCAMTTGMKYKKGDKLLCEGVQIPSQEDEQVEKKT